MSREIDKSASESGELDINKRIKILRIIARMNIGGPAVQVTGLMRELDPKLFEQRLVTGYVAADEADYLLENKIDIPVTRVEGLGRSINIVADLNAFFKLAKIIREYKPDIIHTHTAKAGVLGRTAWILAGYKPILVHTYHVHLLRGYFGKFKTNLVIVIEKTLGLLTNQLLAVGGKVADDLINVGIGSKKKFRIMAPGLSIDSIPDRREICLKYQIDPNKFFCTFLGRVTEIKKPLRFLEIASKFKSANPNIHFLLIGSGELLDDCKAKITAEKLPVTSLGWIPKVEEALVITDLMLLTSENEGMPLSLIQAGMAYIPAISSNVGSVSEVVLHEKTGYVLDFDKNEFSQKVVELYENPDLRVQLGVSANAYTTKHFSIKRLAEDHKDVYKNLIR